MMAAAVASSPTDIVTAPEWILFFYRLPASNVSRDDVGTISRQSPSLLPTVSTGAVSPSERWGEVTCTPFQVTDGELGQEGGANVADISELYRGKSRASLRIALCQLRVCRQDISIASGLK
jgi:hypothetical protein